MKTIEENVKQSDEKNHLIKYTTVKDTPFQIATVSNDSPEDGYYVMFGKYRISEKIDSMEEAVKEAMTIDWWKIMSVCHAMIESITEIGKNLTTQTNEN